MKKQPKSSWRPWNIGELVDNLYQIVDVFESGGMGVVYRAHHLLWNEDVAIKSPRPDAFAGESSKEQFVRECETWIGLALHPNIVTCYYVKASHPVPHIVAEYVDGGSLHDWVISGRLYEDGPSIAIERILDISIQVARGLAYAHEQRVVHQDVKPSNVMMTTDGEAKICDFGLARLKPSRSCPLTSHPQKTLLVSVGGLSPLYCSPEQANGMPVSWRTDVWSWAVMLLEMLFREPYWEFGFLARDFFVQATASLKTFTNLRIPPRLTRLIEKCLSIAPAERPNGMIRVAEELENIYLECVGRPFGRKAFSRIEEASAELNNRALSFWDLGSVDKAIDILKSSWEKDPGNLVTAYNSSLLRWRAGQMTDIQAIAHLTSAGDPLADDGDVNYFLGLLEMERCDYGAADAHFNAVPTNERPQIPAYLRRIRDSVGCAPRCIHILRGHESTVTTLAVAEGTQRIISGSEDKSVRIWDALTGQQILVMDGHADCVYGVAVSEQRGICVSGSWDQTVRVWDTSTGECIRVLEGHRDRVSAVAISPNGESLASSSLDGTVLLWQPLSRKTPSVWKRLVRAVAGPEVPYRLSLAGHKCEATSVNVSRDGKTVVSGGGDGRILCWDANTGQCLRVLEGHTDEVEGLSISLDGRWLLSASHDHTIRLWDLRGGECLRVLQGHSSWVCSVCFSGGSRYAVSGGEDNTVRVWDLLQGRCLRTLEGHSRSVYAVYCDHACTRVISSGEDDTLRIWDIIGLMKDSWHAPAQLCKVADVERACAEQTRFVRELRAAESAAQRGDLQTVLRSIQGWHNLPRYRLDPRTQSLRELVAKHSRRLVPRSLTRRGEVGQKPCGAKSLRTSPDGRWLLSIGGGSYSPDSRPLMLWDLKTGDCVRGFGNGGEPVGEAEFVFDGQYILAVGPNPGFQHPVLKKHYKLHLWETATGRCTRTFSGHMSNVWSVSVTADGTRALSTSADKTIRLWDVSTGDCVRIFQDVPDIFRTVISPDGQYALSGRLRLWDLASGKTVRTFERRSQRDVAVRFSRDGQLAVSMSEGYPAQDTTFALWDVTSGTCLRSFVGHSASVSDAMISDDAAFVVSVSQDRSARLWDIRTGKCLWAISDHVDSVRSVTLTPDSRVLATASDGCGIQVWDIDWEYDFPGWKERDERILPILRLFLETHRPFGPDGIRRHGQPTWTTNDVAILLERLQHCGLGFVQEGAVEESLRSLASVYVLRPGARINDWQ